MNAKKSKGQKILAMAVVAMFAFCAFSVGFTDNDSSATAAGNGVYNINIIENASFSYKPTFNTTTGTIALSNSGCLSADEGANNTAIPAVTYSKTFKETDHTSNTGKLLTDTITATWTPYVGAETDMVQKVSQTINFYVYEKVYINKDGTDLNKSISGQYGTDKLVVEIPITGPKLITVTPEVSSEGRDYLVATYNSATEKVEVKTSSTLGQSKIESPINITVTIDAYDSTNTDNKANTSFDFTIFPDLSIIVSGQTEINTYVGKTGNNPTIFDFNLSNEAGILNPAWSGNVDSVTGAVEGFDKNIGTMNASTGEYSMSLTTVTNDVFASNSDKLTFSISSSVQYNRYGSSDETAESVSGGFAKLNVYKAFAFTVDPKLEQSVVYSASGNPLDILMSADFEGTTKITYNWGDGKSTTVNTNPDAGSKYSARHVYANPGVYVITVTAYNSSGTTTAYTLYDAKNAFFEDITGDTNGDNNNENDNTQDTEQSFFEKHGYQFIIFAVIAVLCLVAFFFFGIQNPIVLIAAIITALLAVLCFVYNDIGGLIEQLKAVLKI